MTVSRSDKVRQFQIMTALIIAGEVIFLLPFVFARIFRPTLLKVFEINNLQLGTAFSLYGIIAAVSYFAGGPLADRYSARKLMCVALVMTSMGGILMASVPANSVMTGLYGFWGVTTILLFWAALIRATREWGGSELQGRAYGFLDGGRGLFAALLASTSVLIFSMLLPVELENASFEQLSNVVSQIILIFSGITLFTAFIVWIWIPEDIISNAPTRLERLSLEGLRNIIAMPTLWLQATIVVCAYVGYKCTDLFSLYASDVFGYNDVEAAQIGTITFWVRPFAAVAAGLIGDNIFASRMAVISFAIMLAGSVAIASGAIQPGLDTILIMTIVGTSVGIYAVRGVYFALLQEAKLPLVYTGSAVGLVSTIGFAPDIFMGPVMGYLLDSSPGILGFQHVFTVVACFAFIGVIAAVLFRILNRR